VVGGVLALSVAPAILTLARGGEELSMAVIAAVVIGSSIFAMASADPAGELLGASPVSLVRRRIDRLGVLSTAIALVWGVVLAIMLWRDPGAASPATDRVAELLAVGGLSALAGASADRRGLSVTSATTVGPMAVLTITTLAYRFPTLPSVGARGDADVWLVVAAVAWAAALWESRDLYGFARRRPAR
jgi:hypothetical protein